MTDFEKTEKSLKTILEKGDLFDIISLRENKTLTNFAHLKAVGLLFSRIFLVSVCSVEKIKSKYAPVEEIKKAQNQIREILNLPIDIIRSKDRVQSFKEKKKETYLMLLYQNEGIAKENYIENIKKILDFCELHNIQEVLLKKKDVIEIVSQEEIKEFNSISLDAIFKYSTEIETPIKKLIEASEILGFYYNIDEEMKEKYLFLDSTSLKHLLRILEASRLDTEVLKNFEFQIKNKRIKQAIAKFLKENDKRKFQKVVLQSLSIALNENNVYKDKTYGKILQNIKIKGEYLIIESFDKEGHKIESCVSSLYDYLEVQNYESLLKKIEIEKEEKEILLQAALYLYLIQEKKLKGIPKEKEYSSLYDYYCRMYVARHRKEIKKIPGLYSFLDIAFQKWFIAIINVLNYYGYIIMAIVTLKNGYDFIKDPKLYKEEVSIESVIHDFNTYYKMPFTFEKNLISEETREKIVEILENAKEDFESNINEAINSFCQTIAENIADNYLEEEKKKNEPNIEKTEEWRLSGKVGDTEELQNVDNGKESSSLAQIIPLKENIEMPNYFACSHAFDSCYFDGEKRFELSARTIDFLKFYEADPLFSVNYAINKAEIERIIFYGRLEFWNTFYPVDDVYVLTSLTIRDSLDPEKTLTWEENKELTQEEIGVLSSMKSPEVSYTYGINRNAQNTFVECIQTSDANNSSKEIKEAIKRGLELEKDASLEEVWASIKNKYYSKTPIEDAHLTEELTSMDEVEYFETIASLDSLICNMAAALAVETDDTLVYTVGFLNTNDEFITLEEAHAWAMSKEGIIVDVTPTRKESKKIIEETTQNIIDWGIKNSLSILGLALLIRWIIKKKYGQKIVFQIHIKRAENLLERPNLASSYANLNKFLYGGKCFPVKRTKEEWLDTIGTEFYAYKKEDLQELKKELLQNKAFENRYRKTTVDLMNNIPFIVENKEELQRNLKKKKER